jgi:hypothetical protein
MPAHAHRPAEASSEADERTEALVEYSHEGAEWGVNFQEAAEAISKDKDVEIPELSGFGMLAGLVNTATGAASFGKGPSVSSGLQVADGAKTIVQNGANLAGYEEFSKSTGKLGGVIDGANALNDLRKGEYDNFVRDGVATGLDYAAPPGASTAWKMGWAGGKMLHSVGNSHATQDSNVLGHNDNLDSFGERWGNSANRDVAKWTGNETLGRVAGAWTDAQAQMIGLTPALVGAGVGGVQSLFGHKRIMGGVADAATKAAHAQAATSAFQHHTE